MNRFAPAALQRLLMASLCVPRGYPHPWHFIRITGPQLRGTLCQLVEQLRLALHAPVRAKPVVSLYLSHKKFFHPHPMRGMEGCGTHRELVDLAVSSQHVLVCSPG